MIKIADYQDTYREYETGDFLGLSRRPKSSKIVAAAAMLGFWLCSSATKRDASLKCIKLLLGGANIDSTWSAAVRWSSCIFWSSSTCLNGHKSLVSHQLHSKTKPLQTQLRSTSTVDITGLHFVSALIKTYN